MKSEHRINYSDQLVTPELAQEWLVSCNTRNRKLKPVAVDLYASDMQNERWTRGSRLMFYSDGTLCDGQNRLRAVVKSGKPCLFDVLVGASFEEGCNIDTGTPRCVQDALLIKGTADWIANKDCVALINIIHRLGASVIRAKLHHSVIEEFATKNEQWLRPVIDLRVTRKKALNPSAYMAQLVAAYFGGVPIDELRDFNTKYITGENYEPEKNSSIRLREYVLTFKGAPWTGVTLIDTAKRTQRAIKAFVDRQAIAKLYAPNDFVYAFPRVIL